MKKVLLILSLMLMPAFALADDAVIEAPHWSVEVKGGRFIPAIENWAQYYGKQYSGEYEASLAYKLFRQLEIGVETGFIRDMGQGLAPLHNVSSGTVTYKLYPVNAFVLVRGVFSEGQWLVPYVGGGWTRMFYWEEVEGQGIARGRTDGRHGRAGLQFLLDGLDQEAAGAMYRDFGVDHTYFFLEAERTHATVETGGGSVNIGGTSYLGGLLFEF